MRRGDDDGARPLGRDRMSRGKAAKPPQAAKAPASNKSTAGSSSSTPPISVVGLIQPIFKPVLGILAVYLLFSTVLPWLAELTPPGVDPKAVAAAASELPADTIARTACENACHGMGCPKGWSTGRAPDDPCKCICVRDDPTGRATEWDLERQKKQKMMEEEEARISGGEAAQAGHGLLDGNAAAAEAAERGKPVQAQHGTGEEEQQQQKSEPPKDEPQQDGSAGHDEPQDANAAAAQS